MFQSHIPNPSEPQFNPPAYHSSYVNQDHQYYEKLTRELTTLDERKARKFEGISVTNK